MLQNLRMSLAWLLSLQISIKRKQSTIAELNTYLKNTELSNGSTTGTQTIRTQGSFAPIKQYSSSLSSQMPITFLPLILNLT